MEHVIAAPHSGIVRGITMTVGDVVREGFPIVFIQEAEVEAGVGRGRRGAGPGSHPGRPAREYRAPRIDVGREPSRRGRAAPQERLSHAARKHRSAGRSRFVRRILAAGGGAPASAAFHGGIAEKHARRRRGCRHVFHQRRLVRRNAFPRGVGALRLHRAGRHAGAPQSLQAGPDVRTGAPLPPAADPVRRGRRRPARRGQYRSARRHRHAHLHHLLTTQRPRADDCRRQRPHLRGQHRAGGVQRRDHRHRGFDARHGRAGDDRRRRARHLYARGSRADVVPGAEWCRRYPGEGRVRRRRYGEKVSVVFPGRDRYLGRA